MGGRSWHARADIRRSGRCARGSAIDREAARSASLTFVADFKQRWQQHVVATDAGDLEYIVFPGGPQPFIGATRLAGTPIAPADYSSILPASIGWITSTGQVGTTASTPARCSASPLSWQRASLRGSTRECARDDGVRGVQHGH